MEPAAPEPAASEAPAVRKPTKETTWMGPKESAVRQHRQEMKTKMKSNKVEEVKPTRPRQVRPEPECPLEDTEPPAGGGTWFPWFPWFPSLAASPLLCWFACSARLT